MTQTQEQSETTKGVDLTPFCGDEDGKYQLSSPFVRDGHRYASDGRICIRVPAPSEANTEGNVPPAHKLKWPKEFTNAVPWPAAEYHWKEQEFFAPDDEDDEFGEWGWMPSKEAQRIGERDIGTKYHYLISRLPGVSCLPEGAHNTPLFFQFDGGQGCIMPRRRDDL